MMKKIIIIGLLLSSKSYGNEDFKVEIDNCSVEGYKEALDLIKIDFDRRVDARECGLHLNYVDREKITFNESGKDQYFGKCTLVAQTQFFCNRMPW
jgi:hypothetical protein